MNNLNFVKGQIRSNQKGGVAEVLTGMIPLYGTYQDYQAFKKEPSLENFGWMVAGGLGDALFFTGIGAGIKGLKGLNAARKSAKAIQNARMATRRTRQVQMLDRGDKGRQAYAGWIQSGKNVANATRKVNEANKQMNKGLKQIGISSALNFKFDPIKEFIQQYTTNE